jgi:hypothetical protein
MKTLVPIAAFLASAQSAIAEIVVQERKNSWDSAGFLWVVGGLAIVVVIAVTATILEKRRK